MRQKSFVIRILCAALALLGLPMGRGDAMSLDGALCDRAAAAAAQAQGVPLPVLLSIARVESGRQLQGARQAWPWTINLNGKGHFFDSADAAMAFASAELDRGNANFDIGCFQVNLRWHARAFASLTQALDPFANAEYAAQFLGQLYRELGDWPQAVAAYHSRTPKHAQAYLGRVEAAWADLVALQTPLPEAAPPEPQPEPRENTYPLLRASQDTARRQTAPGTLPFALR